METGSWRIWFLIALSRLFFMVRLVAMVIVAFALNACGESMSGVPKNFNFEYFESLPQKKIVPAAQTFLESRFPAGSDLKDVQNELIAAGAKCARGVGRQGVYYECDYDKPAGKIAPFVTIEWKIILRPDAEEKRIAQISVNRGLTGL